MIVELSTPRAVVSAPQGKTGKTLAMLALAYTLQSRGLQVQTFKVGPDFIDPTYHAAVTCRPSRNLDVVLHGVDKTLRRLVRYGAQVDAILIEGVFGLFDSPDGIAEVGSTAYIAKITRSPVILVLNAERANKSLLAIVKGLAEFDPKVKITGVLLTNVATETQYRKIERAFEHTFRNITLIGYIPRSRELSDIFRYRHLGLVPTLESGRRDTIVETLKELSSHIKLDLLLEVLSRAEPLRLIIDEEKSVNTKHTLSIGVICDRVFTFYYPETIEKCFEHADKVYFIDSIRDEALPQDLDILIIGGGFPEEHAEHLSKNKSLRHDVRRFSERGGVIYAECGGLMYLMSSIVTLRNEEYEMCGVFEGTSIMLRKPVGHGYVVGEAISSSMLFSKGVIVRGHEFHHSKTILMDREAKMCLRLLRGRGLHNGLDGIQKNKTYAQYMHIHPETYDIINKLVEVVTQKRNALSTSSD